MHRNKIRLSMIGGGPGSLIGIVHRVAAYMGESYQLVGGIYGSDYEKSKDFAEDLGLDLARIHPDIDQFIEAESAMPENQRVEAVAILTPNSFHFEMAKKLVNAGFHIICEKPVTVTVEEAVTLKKLVHEKKIVFSLTHTYTGYPMVRQMKSMITDGVIGKIQKVDAQYYQGWINPLIHEKEKRKGIWRLDPRVSGQSCCFGDIGVHAFNLIEYTTDLQVEKVLADLDTLYDDNPLDIDGTALIRTTDGVRGVVRASQIATGEENNIRLSVYGDKGGLVWEQENPTYLKYMPEGQPAQLLKPGNSYNSAFAQESTKIAPGHPEGLFDAMGNIYSGTAKAIRNESFHDGSFPDIDDGVRGMQFIEAVLKSSSEGQVWVKL